MIIIEKPEVVIIENKARLQTDLDIDGQKKHIWFEVDVKYKDYLCYERSDAFVVALLNYAMREGHDITCKAPIGEELYYQITTYLIDAVYKGSKVLHNTKIIADVDSSKLQSANAVGTGISAGIDSFHTIAEHSNSRFKNHNITHLAFNNVGSHGEGEKAKKLYKGRLDAAKRFSEKYNYELVVSNSNLHEQIQQNHLLTHTYSSCFPIYCLQKLYSIYYYSSSDPFMAFSLKDNEKYGSGAYELLILSMYSTSSLKILSEGGTLSRLEKTRKVANYKPSYKYLNVCTLAVENCSKCEKCTRTLLALDAVNKLDKYKEVFDIEYYKNNKQEYFKTLVTQTAIKNIEYDGVYPLLKKQIKFPAKIKGLVKLLRPFALSLIPSGMKPFLKRQYKKYA